MEMKTVAQEKAHQTHDYKSSSEHLECKINIVKHTQWDQTKGFTIGTAYDSNGGSVRVEYQEKIRQKAAD